MLSLYRLRRCHHPIWNLHLFMNNFFSREIYRFMNYGHAQSVFKWAKKSLDFLILENSFLSTLIHFMTFLYARWRFLLTNHQKIRETLFMFIIQATESKTALNLTILFCRKFFVKLKSSKNSWNFVYIQRAKLLLIWRFSFLRKFSLKDKKKFKKKIIK